MVAIIPQRLPAVWELFNALVYHVDRKVVRYCESCLVNHENCVR
jgi:hypothetical protein